MLLLQEQYLEDLYKLDMEVDAWTVAGDKFLRVALHNLGAIGLLVTKKMVWGTAAFTRRTSWCVEDKVYFSFEFFLGITMIILFD